MPSLGSASITLDAESGGSTGWYSTCRRYGSSRPEDALDSSEAHYLASLKTTTDPNGEPYPAFSSGKSWNEASGKTGSEKKFYHNGQFERRFRSTALLCRGVRGAHTPEVTYGHDAHVVEVPQVQFIDKVVDVSVIRQRQMSVGPSGSCQGEEGQEEREMGGSLVQVENTGAGKTRLTRKAREASWPEWRQTWGRVAHTARPRWTRSDGRVSGTQGTMWAARRLERLERESSQLEDEEREASLGESPHGSHQSREADCRQMVRRQGIRLWQGSHR